MQNKFDLNNQQSCQFRFKMHKVKKRWVFLSTAILLFAGYSAIDNATAHADVADNHSFVTQVNQKSSAASTSSLSSVNSSVTSTSISTTNSITSSNAESKSSVMSQVNSVNAIAISKKSQSSSVDTSIAAVNLTTISNSSNSNSSISNSNNSSSSNNNSSNNSSSSNSSSYADTWGTAKVTIDNSGNALVANGAFNGNDLVGKQNLDKIINLKFNNVTYNYPRADVLFSK